MAAPKGNNNAGKGKLWEGAIRRALNGDRQQLYRIAEKVLKAAEEGQPWAVTEVRNTLDGKPKEHIQVDQTVEHRLSYADFLKETSDSAGLPISTVQ